MFNIRERIASQWAIAKKHLMLVLVFVGVLWVVYILDEILPADWPKLDSFGIWPRTLRGLLCIPAAPFLHADLNHLLGNTFYMALLGWIVVMSGKGLFLRVFIVTALTSGFGAWVFGDATRVHMGISGVLYGMMGFLLARGWCARRLLWTVIALFVGLMHITHLLLLLHNPPNVSWSSHFWGFAGGVALAWWMYGRTPDAGANPPRPPTMPVPPAPSGTPRQ